MDKPTGTDNFITIDELRDHWDVSEKTIRRHIRWRLSHDERERFVRKVPLGQSMKGQDGEEHFFYTLERDFWMDRMAERYPRKRKLHVLKESTDTNTEKKSPEPGHLIEGSWVSSVQHEKELQEWKGMYYHERNERKQERAERQALIQENIKLNKLLLPESVKPKESTEGSLDSGDGHGSDSPPPPENTAQQSHESHVQESE